MMKKGEYERQAAKVFHQMVIEHFDPIPFEIDCFLSVKQGISAVITYGRVEFRHNALLVRSHSWA